MFIDRQEAIRTKELACQSQVRLLSYIHSNAQSNTHQEAQLLAVILGQTLSELEKLKQGSGPVIDPILCPKHLCY